MTCIVGIAENSRTWIGGDGAVTYANDERAETLTPKVWRQGPWLLGAAGAGAWIAILRAVKWPAFSPTWPDEHLPRAMMTAAQGLGLTLPCNDEDAGEYGDALVGSSGSLWRIDCGLDVSKYMMAACGGGSIAARAVLQVTRGRPRVRILKALEVAASMVPGVSAPFTVESA